MVAPKSSVFSRRHVPCGKVGSLDIH